MSLYTRLKGDSETTAKIPIWPFLVSMHRIVDGERFVDDIATQYSLSDVEKTDLQAYLAASQTKLTAKATEFGSTDLARMFLFWQTWMIFSGIEAGEYTETEANTKLLT